MAAEKERAPGLSSAEIGKYLDVLAKDPNSRVFAPLAEAYRKAGLCDDAIEIALEGLKTHPNYLGGRVALGRAYFEKNQLAEAAAEMQKVVKAAPDNIIAHKVLGQIAYRQKNMPAAEKAFKMVLLLDPRDEEAQKFIADLAGTVKAAPAPAPVQPAPPPVRPVPAAAAAPPPLAMPQPPLPQPVSPRPSSPPAPAPLPFDEIQGIEDIDLQADDIFSGQPPAPEDGMELEVFARDQRKGDLEHAASAPPSPAPLPAPEPPSVVPADHEDSPFEVFTRDRGTKAAPAPGKAERAVETGPRELDIETTSFNPPDEFTADGFGMPLASLDEELPLNDLTQEKDFGSRSDTSPSAVAPVSGLEPEPESELEPELETELEPEPEADLELDLASDLESDEFSPPSLVPAPEMRLEPLGEEYEDISPEEEPVTVDAGRGVFDTETLASIYISQGFYGRAAEIYQRLITQHPEDLGLRGKLEDVLALERRESGFEAPAAAVAAAPASAPAPPAPEQERAPAPATPAGSNRTISQLNSLLEAFKGGRPR